MKLLLDANLSWRLMSSFKKHFDDCFHVDHIGLAIPATDIQIWQYAFEHELTIVTNDEDFANLVNAKGFPPKVVLLKTGTRIQNILKKLLLSIKQISVCWKN